MGVIRKFIKKSPDGRFFLHLDRKANEIDFNKKTQLWLSSDFLIKETVEEDPKLANKIIESLITWNNAQEKYEECNKLIEIQKKFIKI